jgi:hypothetical protein
MVEAADTSYLPLCEPPLFFQGRDASPGADPDPDLSLEADGRRIRRLHFHDGHGDAAYHELLDREARDREDVAVRSHVRERREEMVCDVEAHRPAGVVDPNEEVAWCPVSRKVVREGADRLPYLVTVGQGFLALDAVRLEVGDQALKL